jgi:predicted dehydrogenase
VSSPVHIGVVGAGALAVRGILPHLTQDDVWDRVRVVAVCDPAPGRADAAAARFGIPSSHSSIEELLELREVDAVTIVSPIGLHHEHGRLALLAGKHVHFNKTMTTTVAEATELIDLARERALRVVASPGEVLRPHNGRIRELIAEGAIGRLAWAICGASSGTYHEDESERATPFGQQPIDPSWYYRKPGGGPLYDMTVYSLHALTSVLGPAVRVTALSGVRVPTRMFAGKPVETDADDSTIMTLDFGGNLFAIAYGTPAEGTDSFFPTYFGTSGEIVDDLLNGEPFDYPGRERTLDAPDLWSRISWSLPHVTGVHREIDENHVFEDIMQLVDWVADVLPSPVTAEHARHVIDIIESSYRAAETGETQTLSTTFDLPG